MPVAPLSVEVWLEDSSDPITFTFAEAVYQKKAMLCVRRQDGASEWFPIARVFRVRLVGIK